MPYDTTTFLKDVRTRDAISAVDCINDVREHTNFDDLLERAQLKADDLIHLCAQSEQASRSGKELSASVSSHFEAASSALAKQGIEIPHGNVVGRCTPLAAELISMALDPGFATEFEAYAKSGSAPTDPNRYTRGPIRPLPELLSAFLESLATYAPADVAPRLHEGSSLVRNELR